MTKILTGLPDYLVETVERRLITPWSTLRVEPPKNEAKRIRPHLMRMRELIRRSLNYSGSLEIVKMWQG